MVAKVSWAFVIVKTFSEHRGSTENFQGTSSLSTIPKFTIKVLRFGPSRLSNFADGMVVDLYRIAWFSQNTLIILTRYLRDSGKSDEEIKKLLGFDEQVPFEMDREYLRPLFAFVTSRHTDQDNDMYDRWKDYHEQVLRPAYGKDIETVITPDLYDALYEQVKARGIGLHS